MNKLAIIVIALLFIQITASSQSCLPDGITFTTQAEIDNFQIKYPGCTEIEGDVVIGGINITNLNGLSVLTSIGGFLGILQNDSLTSLTGLEGVTSIGRYLAISSNLSLTSLTGLDNLASIAKGIWIGDNAALTSLTGLDNVTSIGEGLQISHNYVLPNLTGLDNMTSIGGWLWVSYNDALTGLTELDNVTSIEGELYIAYNAALTSLTGLNNVTSIGGDFDIVSNGILTSLTGLDNVTSIGGELLIDGNNTLTSLTGLDNIEAGSISDLYIYNNIYLSTCEVQSVCDYLANPNGNISIHDNATECNSQEEVGEACAFWVPNINFESELSVYPNPAKKEIFISVKNGSIINEVNIYNQIGQKVLHKKPITHSIDVSMLRQGMYIIELILGEMKIREKLIIR